MNKKLKETIKYYEDKIKSGENIDKELHFRSFFEDQFVESMLIIIMQAVIRDNIMLAKTSIKPLNRSLGKPGKIVRE